MSQTYVVVESQKMSLGDSSCYPYIQKNHKVFGSKFATHIAFPCFSCTVDLEAFGMCETLPALRSVPKEPKEAPKANSAGRGAISGHSAGRGTGEDEGRWGPGCGSRCFLTFLTQIFSTDGYGSCFVLSPGQCPVHSSWVCWFVAFSTG